MYREGCPGLVVIKLINDIPLMIHGGPRRYVFGIDSLGLDLGSASNGHVLPASERSGASGVKVY